jgi:phosphoribosylglycinamide formyltransferase-1
MNTIHNIAILASHNASNLDPVYNATSNNTLAFKVQVLISNNTNANALNKANSYNIDSYIINDKISTNIQEDIYNTLTSYQCKYILLCGYMKKLSPLITNNFIVINSHPSLLPKYGGVGMYGANVHKAVIDNKEKNSGITFHYVNENYDEGKIILQKSISINDNETVESLETKVKNLEQNSIVEALQLCLKSQNT